MHIDFEKWHGLGNDFIVIWLEPTSKELFLSLKKNASLLCRRDYGHVGADGILVCTAEKKNVFPTKVTIINSDGSIAKNCGNGLRCVMGSIWRRSTVLNESIDADSLVELSVEDNTFYGRYLKALPKEFLTPSLQQVAVSMPAPVASTWSSAFTTFAAEVSKDIKVLNCFSIGNPHAIAEWTGSNAHLYSVASKLQEFECEGSKGINLHIVSKHTPETNSRLRNMAEHGHKNVWVWERGVGPTNACGSGACAVAAHAYAEFEADYGEWVEVKMPGGLLWVRQKAQGEDIELMGPTEMTFSGELYI